MIVHITPRQRQVLVLAAEGASIEQTAHQLGISPQTVKNIRSTVMRRHGAASMLDLFHRIGWLKIPTRSLPAEPWHCQHGIDLRLTERCYLCEPTHPQFAGMAYRSVS